MPMFFPRVVEMDKVENPGRTWEYQSQEQLDLGLRRQTRQTDSPRRATTSNRTGTGTPDGPLQATLPSNKRYRQLQSLRDRRGSPTGRQSASHSKEWRCRGWRSTSQGRQRKVDSRQRLCQTQQLPLLEQPPSHPPNPLTARPPPAA